LFDKELNKEFAGDYNGWKIGQIVYQQVDEKSKGYNPVSPSPGRDLINVGWDFSQVPDFGAWNTDLMFHREVPNSIKVSKPIIEKGRVAISVECKIKGVKQATCIYWLDAAMKELGIEWEIDKEHVREAEELFIAFPYNLGKPEFRADVNGVAFSPDSDQLPGTVKDWFPIRNWVDVSDDSYGVTMAPIDAPLTQFGGITTSKAAAKLDPEGANLMSWALNNHWIVNFKASQGGLIPLRYRLTTHAGKVNDATAAKFANEVHNPAVVMRDYVRKTPEVSKSFISIRKGDGATITTKESTFDDGIVLRVHSSIRKAQSLELDLTGFDTKKVEPITVLEESSNKKVVFKDGILIFELLAGEYASFKLIK